MQRTKEVGEFLLRPVEHVLREQAAPRTQFNDLDSRGRSESAPHLVELACQQTAEDSMHVARSIEIAGLAELRGVAGIIAEFRIVEATLHVTREGNRSALANLVLYFLAQLAHKPLCWRSVRSCGVRMNISMK